VAVLEVAVEENGWQGSTEPVPARASAAGPAASMFWNINAVTRLSFAGHGQVLLSQEPFDDLAAPPSLAGVLAGLPESQLRDLAWRAAAQAVRYAGLDDDPDFAASITARALTIDAARFAAGPHAANLVADAHTRIARPTPP